ncbi:MAG: hypothetical protein AAFN74_01730 [Myxococcota bacterium]
MKQLGPFLLLICGCIQDLTVLTPIDGSVDTGTIDAESPEIGVFDGLSLPSDVGIPVVPLFAFGRRLATGLDHGCAIRNDGVLRCWGLNEHGQLGVGDTEPRNEPVALPDLWFEVSADGNSTCGIKQDGTLWCWGQNREGGLGQNDTLDRFVPTEVAVPCSVQQIAVGANHVCAQAENGKLYCWGANEEGQLGQQDTPTTPLVFRSPTELTGTWDFVSAGSGHSCAIDVDGRLFCWGRNTQSQLGLGNEAAQERKPTRVGRKRWRYVTASQAYSCGITTNEDLFCWGNGEFGRTARGNQQVRDTPGRTLSPFDGYQQLSSGWFSACGVRADRSVWCWGRNTEGQLGLGETEDRDRPHQMPNVAAQDVAVGRFFTCVLTVEGRVACTGRNSSSQLGVSLSEDQVSSLIFQNGWR